VKIETDTSDITHGDSIVVETEENGNDVVYVGRVNTVEMHDVVDVAFAVENDWYKVVSTDTSNQWVRRFINSGYETYLRAEVKDSDKIEITGL